jgi:hypothetical protein
VENSLDDLLPSRDQPTSRGLLTHPLPWHLPAQPHQSSFPARIDAADEVDPSLDLFRRIIRADEVVGTGRESHRILDLGV